MQRRSIAAVLIVATWWAQAGWCAPARDPSFARQTAPVQTGEPAGAAPASAPAGRSTIDVPAGTTVPLNLVSTIKSRSSKPGDTVQAVVAFPVTVGNQVAIPAGTYVQGTLIRTVAPKGTKKSKKSGPALQIHFTKLLFANGYTVALDAENAAMGDAPLEGATPPANEMAAVSEYDPAGYAEGAPRSYGPSPDEALEYAPQFFPEPTAPPPLPQVGPSKAVVIGSVVGGFAVFTALLLVMAHHVRGGGSDSVLYAAGWQFQMTLAGPLAVDKAQVMAAASAGAMSH